MSRPSKDKAALAADVWRRLFDFFVRSGQHRTRVLAKYGLTPNDSRALHTLDRREGRTMRELATAWSCDASNATWIVDRLEARGLAERQAKPGDRRVKLVLLTAAGAKTLQSLQEAMYEPPADLAALPKAALEELSIALAKLPMDATDHKP